MRKRPLDNERGVALLIVLLVTALLVALVFEFAYATRVSLRAAVNFRDSQRAEFLARSGVSVAGRMLSDNLKNAKPRDNLEQREWMVVPMVSAGDTELRVRWDDESGKINIGPSFYSNSLNWFKQFLEDSGISQNIVDKIKDEKSNRINLVSELHQFLRDEEFIKVEKSLTVHSDGNINVNTASETVLNSVLKVLSLQLNRNISVDTVLMGRKDKPIEKKDDVGLNVSSVVLTSDYFKVYSHATVGEYTRQVESVIRRDAAGFSILYWKTL